MSLFYVLTFKAAQKKCAVPLAEDLNEKNYEDLLATAILNKV